MMIIALALRLVVMIFLLPEQFDPNRPASPGVPEQPQHFHIGFESGRIAYSIVQGKGYSSPLYSDTGPTAWTTPVYPYVVAAAFKMFGTFSRASVIALLSLNALSSALVCVVVFFMALRTFGVRTAKWAGWAWAFCPYGVYFPVERIWETFLATFLMCLIFMVTLYLEDEDSLASWIGYGALWGLGALTSAVMVAMLPFLGVWVVYRRHRLGKRWFFMNVMASLAFLVVVTPWFVRNYRTFHRFIPFRDGMGLTLYVGANDKTGHWKPQDLGPWNNSEQWEEFQRRGELAYMDHKKEEAIAFIKTHPRLYMWKALRRAVFIWTGFWSFDHNYLQQEPYDIPNIVLSTALSLLAALGLRQAWKVDRSAALPYAIALVVFPAIYYFTTPELYYRRPLDPFLTTLAVAAVVRWRARERTHAIIAVDPVGMHRG